MSHLSSRQRISLARHTRRRGAAAVEAALVLPILIGITFGAVDIAQYINLSHIVTNASREAALLSSDRDTLTVQQVKDAVTDYITESLPGITPEQVSNGLSVTVQQGSGTAIPSGDLRSISSGNPIKVKVSFDFTVVRWLKGPNYWNGNVKESLSVGRRE